MTIVSASGVPHLTVAICVPCQDTCNAGFAVDLARLVARTTRDRPDIGLPIIQHRGTIIPQQRAHLVLAAQKVSATHLLWIDSDMRFPPDGLFQLLACDAPIVAANYATRRPPILPTAEHRDLGLLFTPPDAHDVVEVTHCGMGFMLVDMAVYARMPQPWFALGFNPTDLEYVGEDFFFCKRAKEHGFATLVDQHLSQSVRHVGEMEFTAAHAIHTRDTYNAKVA